MTTTAAAALRRGAVVARGRTMAVLSQRLADIGEGTVEAEVVKWCVLRLSVKNEEESDCRREKKREEKRRERR